MMHFSFLKHMNFYKTASIIQLLLIFSTILGLENTTVKADTFESSLSSHNPIHEHSNPCHTPEHGHHVYHFGHCVCTIFSGFCLESQAVLLSAQLQGLSNQTLTSFDFRRSLFRPPISNS